MVDSAPGKELTATTYKQITNFMISADSRNTGRNLFVPRVCPVPFDTAYSRIVCVVNRINVLALFCQIRYAKVEFVVFDDQECFFSNMSMVYVPDLFPELD